MMDEPHILVVDDDGDIRDLLAQFLRVRGFRASTAADGRAMSQALASHRFDLVVLDIMLPGEDGLSLCRRLRANSDLPIILLTAISEDTDRIVGLEMGADDYVTKPFNPRELIARIRAVLRRVQAAHLTGQSDRAQVLTFAGWRLNITRRELRSKDDVLVPLTSGEYDLLVAFAERPQRVLTRDQLLDLTKGRDAAPFDRSIDVQLSRLRRKIEPDPKDPSLIKTVRGEGYILATAVVAE